MWLRILMLGMLLLCLSGCATPKRQVAGLHTHQLQERIAQLEKQLQEKNEEMRDLESELESAHMAKSYPVVKGSKQEPKTNISEATPKQIQTALKNAGFYNGPIDGKIGERTKKAVKEFQRANDFTPDGVVGKKTWVKLSRYLK